MYTKVLLIFILLCVGYANSNFATRRRRPQRHHRTHIPNTRPAPPPVTRKVTNLCEKVVGHDFLANPDDCSRYILCIGTTLHDLSCGNQVWDDQDRKCVEKGTTIGPDPCQKPKRWGPPQVYASPPRKVPGGRNAKWRFAKPVCTAGSTRRIAHPSKCAQYYDCGSNPQEDWWGTNLRECPYPLLFNVRFAQCDHYSNVRCGRRTVPLDPCDYIANQCRTISCPPCIMRYGTCKGLPNGLHPWKNREQTPHFLVCKDQRVVFHGKCMSPTPGYKFVFDPVIHTCLQPKDGYKFP
ncbi:uncharacterized protein LOC132546555 [Ylistrum balloti]|uniref:uncharacterized protein LOC132546555 n=1 Tax=Ylistrum balloti TaxID=509963 RepID=UPI0029059272|nr:uncharacterized protein LOC132546555 [Ylistrum balloti]